jgi:broad specificity phosphatase PhoE
VTVDLWLARHGETEWSRSGRHTGTTDVPLTPNGTQQARALGTLIGDHPFSRVLSSPLLRALETARLAGFADRVEVSDLLREYDYGTYEGRTTADIQRERPGWELFRDGCPGGESPDEVATRMGRFLAQLGRVESDVLLFGHGHSLRALAAMYLDAPIGLAGRLSLVAGSLSILGHEHGRSAIALWNRSFSPPSNG